MSSTLRYLHHPASQPCRTARQFMIENEIAFEDEIVDITTDINERKEFRDEYNPTGQVPILCDGDLRVWENVAIGRYLNEKFNCPSHWFGATLEESTRINMFAQWYAYTLRLGGGAFHWTIFAPLIYGKDKDFTAERRKGKHLLYESMDLLENYWLENGDYVCGNEITYADLCAFHEFVSHDAGKIIPDTVWKKHPKITAWFARISERPAAKAVSEWQYDAVSKVMSGEMDITFTRRTAVLKGTEAHGGHNNGIPHLGEKYDYIAQVES
ncbi:MAG: glutathione binding-like protein [Burkholderiaceae bacterium]